MQISNSQLDKIAYILKSVAHPARLRIIDVLGKTEEMAVNEICEAVGCEQSATSHHLSNMKLKGLITARRNGKFIYYSLKERDLLKLIDCLENCNCNFAD